MGTSSFSVIYPEETYQVPLPVTVLIDTPWSELPEELQVLLNKILQAVGQSMASVRILQQATADVSTLVEKPQRVIAFVPPAKGVPLYETVEAGGCKMLFSDPLEKLAGDDASKRKLWNGLKSMFSA
jgi:hypothetical protein